MPLLIFLVVFSKEMSSYLMIHNALDSFFSIIDRNSDENSTHSILIIMNDARWCDRILYEFIS